MSPPRYVLTFSMTLSLCLVASFLFPGLGRAQDKATETAESKTTDFKTLKSPIANTKKSIDRGKMLYARLCTECHGPDGKALMDVVADATDLTAPKLWYSGTTEGEVFRSIRNGAGESMPPFSFHIKRDEDIWHLVNYTRSLWPESKRPRLQEETEKKEAANGSAEPSGKGGRGREQENER